MAIFVLPFLARFIVSQLETFCYTYMHAYTPVLQLEKYINRTANYLKILLLLVNEYICGRVISFIREHPNEITKLTNQDKIDE